METQSKEASKNEQDQYDHLYPQEVSHIYSEALYIKYAIMQYKNYDSKCPCSISKMMEDVVIIKIFAMIDSDSKWCLRKLCRRIAKGGNEKCEELLKEITDITKSDTFKNIKNLRNKSVAHLDSIFSYKVIIQDMEGLIDRVITIICLIKHVLKPYVGVQNR